MRTRIAFSQPKDVMPCTRTGTKWATRQHATNPITASAQRTLPRFCRVPLASRQCEPDTRHLRRKLVRPCYANLARIDHRYLIRTGQSPVAHPRRAEQNGSVTQASGRVRCADADCVFTTKRRSAMYPSRNKVGNPAARYEPDYRVRTADPTGVLPSATGVSPSANRVHAHFVYGAFETASSHTRGHCCEYRTLATVGR